jgi:hypothetical protein
MNRKPKAEHPGAGENSAASVGTQLVSLFLAAMLQWATVLVVCPSLHELIHHDADDEHHDCAVTLFLAGQVEQPIVDPIVLTHRLWSMCLSTRVAIRDRTDRFF